MRFLAVVLVDYGVKMNQVDCNDEEYSFLGVLKHDFKQRKD
jgi:hypothetical protein